VRAVEPQGLVEEALGDLGDEVSGASEIHLAAAGKAAAAMARGARQALGPRLSGGVVIVPKGGEAGVPRGFEVYGGGHPVPDEEGVLGARAIHRLASDLGAGDLLLCLISGGGSALMTLPPEGVSLAEVRAATGSLLRSGAAIGELNGVRKHLDQLKGGRLARLAAPARVLALVLSDVVGDPLDVIASGPVSPDPSTFAEAVGVLRRRGVWDSAPPAVREHLTAGLEGAVAESPAAGDPCFERVEARIVGSNRLAAEAALAEAGRRGYGTLLLTTLLTGEAREVGRVLASVGLEVRRSGRPIAAPACLAAAGETTVTVAGAGRGGRNQEVALGAALALDGSDGVVVASLGTDGVDGPTDAAGAFASGATVRRARERGLDPVRALAGNDAYPFFRGLGDLIVTGPTGTNVMDVAVVMVR
jgi:hydroxypyruvate reductase